jgi:hypothetical protein
MRKRFSPNIRLRRNSVLTLVVLAWSAAVAADSHLVNFDASTDFSKIKTFRIRNDRVTSAKPELNNRLFRQRLEDAIRAELSSRGLQESSTPDVFIDVSLSGADISSIERNPGQRFPGRRGMPAVVIPGSGPQPELSTEGTLVIDLVAAGSDTVVWRGTYRDEESSAPTLSRKLSEDARKLLSEYPPKKK